MFGLCSSKPTRQEGSLVIINGVSLAGVSDALRERVPNQLLKRLHTNMLYMPGSTIPMKSEYPNITQRMVKLIEKSQHLAAAGHTVCLEMDDPLRASTGLARRMLQRSPIQVTSVLGYSPISRLVTGPAQQAALNLIGFGMHFKGAQTGPGVDYLSRKDFDGAMASLKKAFGPTHDGQVKTLIVSQFLSSALGMHGAAKGVYLHPRSAFDVVVNVSNPTKAAKQLWSHISASSPGATVSRLFSSAPLPADFGCRACKKPFSRGLCGACLHNLQHTLHGSNFVRAIPRRPYRPHQQQPENPGEPSPPADPTPTPAWPGLVGGVEGLNHSLHQYEADPNIIGSGAAHEYLATKTLSDAALWIKVPRGVASPNTDYNLAPFDNLEDAKAASLGLGLQSDGVVQRGDQFYVIGNYSQVIAEDTSGTGYLKIQPPAGGCSLDLFRVRKMWVELTGADPSDANVGLQSDQTISVREMAPYFMSKYQIPAHIVQLVVNAADIDGNGRLSFDEFVKFMCSSAIDATLGQYADRIRQEQRAEQQKAYAQQGRATAQFRNAPAQPVVIGSDPIGSHSDSGFNVGVAEGTVFEGVVSGTEGPEIAQYGEDQLVAHAEPDDGSWKPVVSDELRGNKWIKELEIERDITEFGENSVVNPYDKWAWPNGTQEIPDDTRFFCSAAFPIEGAISDWNFDVGDPFADGDSGIKELLALQAEAAAKEAADHEARKKLYTAAP